MAKRRTRRSPAAPRDFKALAARYFAGPTSSPSREMTSIEDALRGAVVLAAGVESSAFDGGDATAEVHRVVEEGKEAGWALVRCLVSEAPDDEALLGAAVGPVEAFLRASTLRGLPEKAFRLAEANPRFRKAFLGTWCLPEKFARVQARLALPARPDDQPPRPSAKPAPGAVPARPLLLSYSGCGTCRRALKWLAAQGVTPTVRPIVEEPPTEVELRRWTARSGLPLRKWLNTSGQSYRALGKAKVAAADEATLAAWLAADGKLVKRPVLVHGASVVVGFDEAKYAALFR